MTPPDALLPEVLRHLESCYPAEGCGVLLRARRDGAWRMRPLRNALASRSAYAFEPSEWLQVLLDAERQGEAIQCVFHSHVEAGVEFSAEDVRQAAPGGEPLLPGVSYLVVEVSAGRAGGRALYQWRHGTFERVRPP